MLAVISSANVSCGFHAGSPERIRETLAAAARRGVAVGAHPSYRDYEGFGRRALDPPSSTLQAEIEYQLGALGALAVATGTRLRYVKPHGGLYNTIARDERQAKAVVAGIKAVDSRLVLLGLAGGTALAVAERSGLAVAAEAFADRAYRPDGSLLPRSEPGAVLHDPAEVSERMLRFAERGLIRAVDGTDVAVRAQSVCVHGDTPGAVRMAAALRYALEDAGIAIRSFVVEAG
jgi:UPF0271 protein